ncbi:protocadherin Fat 4-like isoform X2 [Mytilus californianus]|uniref:protocadherin Fat 4-like isoform X2 n=1 Tax=Mytilus californianus TaxID=6549 RepID=UPI002244FE0C|nr:protocadherin Fat 4-like isoform X2 [Mytilus californianus]
MEHPIQQAIVTVAFLLTILHSVYGEFQFTKFMQDYNLFENTPEGPLNYTLQTTGATGQVLYNSKVDVRDVFQVNAQTGAVSLIRVIDREDEPQIAVEFIAFDVGTNVEIRRPITIQIRDVNDEKPQFSSQTMKTSLPENSAVGTTVYANLQVTDVDFTNSKLVVTCDPSVTSAPQGVEAVYKDSCNKFKLNIDSDSNKNWIGHVTLAEPVDYEVQAFYQIPLAAFDGIQTQIGSIEVSLINVQDTPPYFTRAVSTTVTEGIPAGSFLEYVEAVDGDRENAREIRYELACDIINLCHHLIDQLVRLDPVSGNITTNVTFDRESQDLIIGYIDLGIRAREVINATANILGSDPSTTAYTTIRINVIDANDNSPKFAITQFNVSIAEDIPNQSPLPSVILTVSDPDLANNAYFEFELSNYNAEFEVSPSNGQGQTTASILIKDTNLINYETGPTQYIFNVIARETRTAERRTGVAKVIVNVIDVNDNLPTFNPPNYDERIVETAPGGTIVVTVTATDPDSGILGNSGIRFGLLGDGSPLFKIDEVSGQVTIANCPTPGSGFCIDYEQKSRYDLTVTARDSGGSGQTVTSNLVIHIDDVNDNSPKFATKNYISYIEELRTVPNPQVVVVATDPDNVGGPISYSLIQESTLKWQINSSTGNITAKQPILYDDAPGVNGSFIMTVQASDGTYVDTGTVTIYVIDLNNNGPKFDISDYYGKINEKTLGNHYILTVRAQDKDSPTSDAGKIDYSINTGASGKFVINTASGDISTSPDATFDFDVKKEYVMQVLARDRGRPQQTGTSTVTIEITDENNKDPFFVPSTMRAEVYENVAIGYSLFKVSAQDPDDNSILRFAFTEPKSAINPDGVQVNKNIYDYSDLFAVDPVAGHVLTNAKLDRDKASVVTLTMTVTDTNASPQQTGTGTLIINILEYNDQAPEFLPHGNITIDEERPIGTFVMALLARDQDDAIAEYSLPYNPSNFFAIGFQTGVLSVSSRIDFEKIEQTYFTALVYDTGVPRLSASTTVYVTIRNINDNSPIFTQTSYTARINEGEGAGKSVVTVLANDADKGDYGVVRYEIKDPLNRFLINDTTGEITVAPGAVLDRETTPQIDVQVTAYDSPLDASVRRFTNVRVYISLDDINDNPPVFTQSNYVATIIETVPVGIQVLQVFATDADIGYNAEIAYTISNNTGDPTGFFSIAEKSGRIRVAKSLLRNSGVYTFIVQARDQDGNGPYTHTAHVQITVLEATNSPPRWVIPPDQNMTVSVLENQYLGMIVYDVHAEDSDKGNNGIIDYGFFAGGIFTNQTDEFLINSITGVISARIVYDREQVPRYVLLLMAKDRGTPTPLDATRYLTIQIKDVNDNIPKFPQLQDGSTRPIQITVSENVNVGDKIGEAIATDNDENPKIFYYIIGGNEKGKFSLDKITGVMKLAAAVDSEQQKQYILDVHATNNVSDYTVVTNRRKRALSPDIVQVIINIRNTNDAPPEFEQSSYTGCISTRAPIGQSIVTVYAKDQDSFGGVQYSIKSGNSDDGLEIGSNTGVIYNRKLMADFISRGVNQFNLVVRATDKQLSDESDVLIFVTQEGNEVELVITQPPLEVRQFVDQIKTTFESLKNSDGSSVFKFVCISAVKDHVTSGEQQDSYWSDVYLSAISSTNYIYTGEQLLSILNAQKARNTEPFDLLYIKSLGVADDEPTYVDGTPAMVVMIIVLILLFFIIIFVIVACYCIRRSKQNMKQNLIQRRNSDRFNQQPEPPILIESLHPMYDNKGFVSEDPAVQYATVQKTFMDSRPREPVPQEQEIVGPESIDAVIRDNDDDSGSSQSSTPPTPRRLVEPEVEDFRIETEVYEE